MTAELRERARASVSRDEVVDLARRLVQIPTENPPGATREAAELLVAELAGWQLERFEPEPGVVSLLAEHRFPAPGRTLLVNGHLDVVPVGEAEWTHDPWGGELAGGRLYGRGSMDMKGALAGLVVAARSVVRAGLPLRGRLVLAAVADEERGGLRGARALVEAGKVAADGAIIVEPGEGGVVVAHKGSCVLALRTRGRAAHASVPWRGENAVEAMVDVLRACRSLELGHEPHPLLGSPTVAVGTTIAGGEKENVIPSACRATLDIRYVPGMSAEGIVADLLAHLRAGGIAAERLPDVEVIRSSVPIETPTDAAVVRAAADAHAREFGEGRLVAQTASTDARWFAGLAGIPTVSGLGPGGVEGCHVVDESIDLDELAAYARVYADAIAAFLSGSPGASTP